MKKESLLMDMEAESPESTSESFTLESILAEFGSSGKKTGRQPTENKAQAAALEPTDGQTPEMPAKPTAEGAICFKRRAQAGIACQTEGCSPGRS